MDIETIIFAGLAVAVVFYRSRAKYWKARSRKLSGQTTDLHIEGLIEQMRLTEVHTNRLKSAWPEIVEEKE